MTSNMKLLIWNMSLLSTFMKLNRLFRITMLRIRKISMLRCEVQLYKHRFVCRTLVMKCRCQVTQTRQLMTTYQMSAWWLPMHGRRTWSDVNVTTSNDNTTLSSDDVVYTSDNHARHCDNIAEFPAGYTSFDDVITPSIDVCQTSLFDATLPDDSKEDL